MCVSVITFLYLNTQLQHLIPNRNMNNSVVCRGWLRSVRRVLLDGWLYIRSHPTKTAFQLDENVSRDTPHNCITTQGDNSFEP